MSIDPTLPPDPVNSPIEKYLDKVARDNVNPALQQILRSDTPTKDELLRAFAYYDEAFANFARRHDTALKQWANTHTHPAQAGGGNTAYPVGLMHFVTVRQYLSSSSNQISTYDRDDVLLGDSATRYSFISTLDVTPDREIYASCDATIEKFTVSDTGVISGPVWTHSTLNATRPYGVCSLGPYVFYVEIGTGSGTGGGKDIVALAKSTGAEIWRLPASTYSATNNNQLGNRVDISAFDETLWVPMSISGFPEVVIVNTLSGAYSLSPVIFTNPLSCAADRQGNCYVADGSTLRKLDSSGAEVWSDAIFTAPSRVTLKSDDEIVAFDNAGNIAMYDSLGVRYEGPTLAIATSSNRGLETNSLGEIMTRNSVTQRFLNPDYSQVISSKSAASGHVNGNAMTFPGKWSAYGDQW